MRNSPSTGAAFVTLYGAAFGTTGFSLASRLANTASELTFWTSDSSLRCRPSDARGKTRRVSVTAGSHTSSATQALSLESGVVSVVLSANWHATGASSVTLLGAAFSAGASRTQQSRQGASSSEASVWMSDSSLVSLAPAATRSSKRISVTVAEATASVSGGFSYNVPLVSAARSTGRLEAFNSTIQNALRAKLPHDDLIQVHVAIARATLSAAQCATDPGTSIEIEGRLLKCYVPPSPDASVRGLTKAAADVEIALLRIQQEKIQDRYTGDGNLTQLLDTYVSLTRYYDALEGCTLDFAPAALTKAQALYDRRRVLASREVGSMFNCSDYFLDMSVVTRVLRLKAVQSVLPQLVVIAGSTDAGGGDVVQCMQTPLNGALRRVERSETTLEEELPHSPDLVRACINNGFTSNASLAATTVLVANSPCTSTEWTSSSSLVCALKSTSASTQVTVLVHMVLSTHVQPFNYGPPRDGANIPTNIRMLTRITGSSFSTADYSPHMRIGGGGVAGGGGGGGGGWG